jgi:hypothetical protein
MGRSSLADWVVSVVMRAVLRTIVLLLELLLPLLLLLAVALTRWVLTAVDERWPLTVGRIYLFCIGGWMGISLLCLPAIEAHGGLRMEAVFMVLGGGCLVGLSVAAQLARTHVTRRRELPRPDPAALHGIHPSMTASAEQAPEPMTWEELVGSGVVLGNRVGGRRP